MLKFNCSFGATNCIKTNRYEQKKLAHDYSRNNNSLTNILATTTHKGPFKSHPLINSARKPPDHCQAALKITSNFLAGSAEQIA